MPFEPPSRPSPIFLVDDDEMDRTLFSRLLRDANAPNPCQMFARGELLIDALIGVLRGAPLPLACFVDVRMPGMSGFDVLRWIRCQRALDDVAVVMLSSSDDQSHLNEAAHFGAQCYVAKFPPLEQFCHILKEAERMADASVLSAFKLPCNLIAGSGALAAR